MGAAEQIHEHALAAGALQSVMTVLYYALQDFLRPYGLPLPSEGDDRPSDLALQLLCIQRHWDTVRASVAYPDELLSTVKQAHLCRNVVAHQTVMTRDQVLLSLHALVKLAKSINASSDLQALVAKLVGDHLAAAGAVVDAAQTHAQTTQASASSSPPPSSAASPSSCSSSVSSPSSKSLSSMSPQRNNKASPTKQPVVRKKPKATWEECKAKGNDCHRAGHFEDAVRWYSRALKLSPENAVLFGNRAISHESKKDYAAAYSDAQEALELLENEPASDSLTQRKVKYLRVVIRSLLQMDMVNQAQLVCARALEIKSDDRVLLALNQQTLEQIDNKTANEAMDRFVAQQETVAKQLEEIAKDMENLFDEAKGVGHDPIDQTRDVLDLTTTSSTVRREEAVNCIMDAESLLTVETKNGYFVPATAADSHQAVSYLIEAGNQGLPEAWYRLANLYNGVIPGIAADALKTRKYLERAATSKPYCRMPGGLILAELGVAEAEAALGKMYKRGLGQVKMNEQRAFDYYMKAAKHGHVQAQYQVAVAYLLGIGVQTDVVSARKWMACAAKRGDMVALMAYALITEQGIGGDKNVKRAVSLYRTAHNMGCTVANEHIEALQRELQGSKPPKRVGAPPRDEEAAMSALLADTRARAAKGSLTAQRFEAAYYLERHASLCLRLGEVEHSMASFRSLMTVWWCAGTMAPDYQAHLLQVADEYILGAPGDVNAAVVTSALAWWVKKECRIDILKKAIDLTAARPESTTKQDDMADLYYGLSQLYTFNRQYTEALGAWTTSIQARRLPFRMFDKANIMSGLETVPFEDIRRAFRAYLAVNPPDEVNVAGAYYGLAAYSISTQQQLADPLVLASEVLQPIVLGRAADQLQPTTAGFTVPNDCLRDTANEIWRKCRMDSCHLSGLMSTCQFCQQSVRTTKLLRHQMGELNGSECPGRTRINTVPGLDLDALRPAWTHELDK